MCVCVCTHTHNFNQMFFKYSRYYLLRLDIEYLWSLISVYTAAIAFVKVGIFQDPDEIDSYKNYINFTNSDLLRNISSTGSRFTAEKYLSPGS